MQKIKEAENLISELTLRRGAKMLRLRAAIKIRNRLYKRAEYMAKKLNQRGSIKDNIEKYLDSYDQREYFSALKDIADLKKEKRGISYKLKLKRDCLKRYQHAWEARQ